MGANRLLSVLMVLVLISQIHLLFAESPEGSGNLFPFQDYPQTFQWYAFSLGNKVKTALLFWLVWRYAHKSSFQEGMVAIIFLMFEVKEIADYLLFANQLSGLYDVVSLLILGLALYIIHLWSNRTYHTEG